MTTKIDIENDDFISGIFSFKNDDIENEFKKLSKDSIKDYFDSLKETFLMAHDNQIKDYSQKVVIAYRTKEKLFKTIVDIYHDNNNIHAILSKFEPTDMNGYLDFINEAKKM